MLITLVFWILITLIIFPYGILTFKLLKIKLENISGFILVVSGILPLIILATLWGFFYRINIELLILISGLSVFLYFLYKETATLKCKELTAAWRALSIFWKVSAIAFVIITAIQSSMPTNIPDDGYYYLQTIKWANEVGIPTGVARFGIQYGQFSGWHIMQAVFNVSFIFGNQINVLNGWIMIIFVLWIVFNFRSAEKNQRFFYLFAASMVTVLQYYNTAPSPDLPVIIISFIVFKIILFDKTSANTTLLIILLSLLAFSIKTSAFFLFFFVFVFSKLSFLRNYKLIMLASLVGLLIIGKSLITTGTFVYPLNSLSPSWVEWKVDNKILDEGANLIKNSSIYGVVFEENIHTALSQKFNLWFNHEGYRGLANKIWIFGIVILGIISIIIKSKKYFFVFVISAVHFFILWGFAPNYRFGLTLILLNYYIIFNYLLGAFISPTVRVLLPIALLSSLIWLTPIISPILNLSSNPVISIRYPMKSEYLLWPTKPFVSESYEKKVFNGEEVFIPPNYHYAWDGPLPCVMRNHYEKYGKEK